MFLNESQPLVLSFIALFFYFNGKITIRMSWIKIKYSRCIKYKATPYDVEYEEYLNKRYSMTPFLLIKQSSSRIPSRYKTN